MIDLVDIGWDDQRQGQLASCGDGAVIARVAGVDRGRLDLWSADGLVWGKVAGSLELVSSAVELPAVGDWVVCREDRDYLLVERILPRRSCFIRRAAGRTAVAQPIAANVDRVLVVVAVGEELNPRRIERYLAAVWAGGAEPIVVLNKIDRPGDPQTIADVQAVLGDVPLIRVSALHGKGVTDLVPLLEPRSTIALVGSSGVGKTTLCNRFLGEDRYATAEVRAGDEKGRHRTTRRALTMTATGVILVDTPGMRELGLWEADEGVSVAFSDVEELAEGCRFRDCKHSGEPACAVARAVEQGVLPPRRLQSYRSLRAELEATAARVEERQRKDGTKQRWRGISKDVRRRRKLHGKLGLKDR